MACLFVLGFKFLVCFGVFLIVESCFIVLLLRLFCVFH